MPLLGLFCSFSSSREGSCPIRPGFEQSAARQARNFAQSPAVESGSRALAALVAGWRKALGHLLTTGKKREDATTVKKPGDTKKTREEGRGVAQGCQACPQIRERAPQQEARFAAAPRPRKSGGRAADCVAPLPCGPKAGWMQGIDARLGQRAAP